MITHRAIALRLCHHTRLFSTTRPLQADFTHAVIGGGAVGLAIARRLQQVDGARVVLIEKHHMVGTETSSRNSEVIHAGLYYGHNTLKTDLCIQGKQELYKLCSKHRIPYRNCGKWIVAQSNDQLNALNAVHEFAKSVDVPTRFISKDEASRREPDVRAESGALESPSTGIVDSHSYMQYLLGDFENSGGLTAVASPVTRVRTPRVGKMDWTIWTMSSDASKPTSAPLPARAQGQTYDDDTSITAETIINSAGLHACAINNMILPPNRHRQPFFAKGTYFSYAKSYPKPSLLIYPAPVPGHSGLGTHLTMDMTGRVRFGPDVEWVDSPDDVAPNVNDERLRAALDDIKGYLPGLDTGSVTPDYCGIRPKLGRSGAQNTGKGDFLDFYIKKEEGVQGFVNLLGIESPGLTSSLAIADYVHDLLYK